MCPKNSIGWAEGKTPLSFQSYNYCLAGARQRLGLAVPWTQKFLFPAIRHCELAELLMAAT